MNFSTVTKVLLRFSRLIFLNYVAETMILHVLEVGCSPRRLVGRMICVAERMICVSERMICVAERMICVAGRMI